jgi:Zn-dependent M28 family amino/carboxypeptidase
MVSMKIRFRLWVLLLSGVSLMPAPLLAQNGNGSRTIDARALLADMHALSADSMEGRRTGTPGSEKARRYLERAFADAGLQPVGSSFRQAFTFGARDSSRVQGVNFIGRIRGQDTSRVIVITAHYDHMGRRGNDIFNGADDNASGVAALLTVARTFRNSTPQHTLLFAALDAEEMGLQGARAFVANPPVPIESVALNVNLDMVSRNEKGELWVAGTHHYPFLRPFVERLAERARVKLQIGHDLPGTGTNDWTTASDHGPFHAAGIPFLYFGVEDHADYHRPTDDPAAVEPDFYVRSVETILEAVRSLDRELDTLVPKRTGARDR